MQPKKMKQLRIFVSSTDVVDHHLLYEGIIRRAKKFGLDGIILGTLISLFFVNFLYGTTIIFKHYFKGQSISKYYFNHLKYFIITLIILVINYVLIQYIRRKMAIILHHFLYSNKLDEGQKTKFHYCIK